MQVSLKPNEIETQLLHVFIIYLKEFKPNKSTNNNKTGISIKRIRIFPRKLNKKLIPKIGITIRIIREYVRRFLLVLIK